jgi:hypothetical protein
MIVNTVIHKDTTAASKAAQLRMKLFFFLLAFVLLFGSTAYGQNIILDVGQEEPRPRWLVLPYAFSSESTDTAYGVAGGMAGYLQPQMSAFAALLGSSNDTTAAFLVINDFQFPWVERLFGVFKGSVGDWTKNRIYAGFSPDFPGERAGSNDSDIDNFLTGQGRDDWFDLTLRYLLPVGHGRDTVINTYTLDNGLMVSGSTGGDVWNPLTSGRLYVELMGFYRKRSIKEETEELEGETNGFQFALEYDNRDYYANPSGGSLQRLVFKSDFGLFDSTDNWTSLEVDLRKYFSLGECRLFRHRAVALNYWTAYSPSWEVELTPEGPRIDDRPPNYMGASLGGFDRLRAYPMHRFSDKAAVLYSAELRLIPHWNPLGNVSWLEFLDIDWWQFVPFAEIGQVAPSWSISDLHDDMKWDVGLGLRAMMQKAVFRLDFAVTDDSSSMWAMVGHPF